MKVDKNILSLFTISEATATREGTSLPEVVDITVKYVWDDVNKGYTKEIKSIVIDTFFYALKKSRLEITLPPNALSARDIKEWQTRIEDEAIITVSFENLKIGLKQGFNREVMVTATADGVREVTG